MRLNSLASAISRGVWLMEPRTAHGYLPMAMKFLSREAVSGMDEAMQRPFMASAGSWVDAPETGSPFSNAQPNSVAIIPICGAIMKEDYCGSPGTDTLSGWIKEACSNSNIKAVVLKINSGGGSVAGTGEFADVIKAASIPVLAYCDGLMASAAYWIGSACKEIYASHQTVEIGSIGTMVSFMDDTEAMTKYGYAEHVINADTSPDKNQDYFEAIKGNYSRIKVNILNPTNDIFMGAVKANRAGKLTLKDVEVNGVQCQEPMTGMVYLAQTAIDNGLIDGVATLDAVVEKALELSQKTSKNSPMNTKSKERVAGNKSVLDKLMSFVSGLKAEEVEGAKADDLTDTEEEPEAKTEDVSKPADEQDDDKEDDGKAAEIEGLKAEVEKLKATIASQNTLLAEAQTALTASNEQLEQNKKEVGATIVSQFKPENSQRSSKAVTEAAVPEFLKPKEGSLAAQAVKASLQNAK